MADPDIIREGIFRDVEEERQRQIGKGYTPAHDSLHTPQDMVKFANWRFTTPLTVEDRRRGQWFSRKTFIEAIAVLVAAVEVMDRRAAKNERS